MDLKPTIFLVMWHGKYEVCFNTSNLFPLHKMKAAGYTVYSFYGETATVHVGTMENDLYRDDALKTANDYMKGNYEQFSVDLDRCVVMSKRGKPYFDLKTPRH